MHADRLLAKQWSASTFWDYVLFHDLPFVCNPHTRLGAKAVHKHSQGKLWSLFFSLLLLGWITLMLERLCRVLLVCALHVTWLHYMFRLDPLVVLLIITSKAPIARSVPTPKARYARVQGNGVHDIASTHSNCAISQPASQPTDQPSGIIDLFGY